MGVRFGLLFVLVLAISSTWVDARAIMISDLSGQQMSYEVPESKIQASSTTVKDERVCAMCEKFTAQAVEYLSENKTQQQVIEDLHLACHKLPTFRQQCITLVDYYAPLFFMELDTINPEDFCVKVDLCGQELIASPEQKQDSCTLCHHAVEEIMDKLKDPDTQLDVIEILLKGCDAVESYVKECKKLVFEYGPLLMDNAEQFLEMTDICTMLHACTTSNNGVGEASSV